MTNFDELLKRSLAIVNEGYQKAYDDLIDVVDRLDQAIKINAGKKFGLEYQNIRNDVKGTIFRIYFDTDVDDPKATALTITSIAIPALGYPMTYGVFNFKARVFTENGKCSDKEELELYFSNFLISPESPLIQAIGFAMRSHGDDEDEEIPF